MHMVSARKKRQSKRRLISQLDDFDRDIIIGKAAGDRLENVVVNEGKVDREFTADATCSNLTDNEKLVNVRTLER